MVASMDRLAAVYPNFLYICVVLLVLLLFIHLYYHCCVQQMKEEGKYHKTCFQLKLGGVSVQ